MHDTNDDSMKRIIAALACFICAFATPVHAQGARADSTACVGRWSPPFPVQRDDGRPVYIEQAMITAFAHQTLALGSPTFFWLGRNHMAPPEALTDKAAVVWSFSRAGALMDSAGTAVGLPPVDTLHPRNTPRLMAQDEHTAFVAWAAADSESKSPGANDNRVEVASFDGQRWSAPRTIITAPHITLDPTPAVRAGRGLSTPVIAVSARDSAGYFVRVARANGENWITSDWRGQIFTILSAVASEWTDGSVTLIVMGSLHGYGPVPVPGVYSVRGEPNANGYTWAQPQLIDSLRDSYEAFSSARLGGDSLVVAWYGPRVKGEAGVLNTALSIDRGRSWALTPSLSPRSAVDGVQLAVDSSGGLHAVFRGVPEAQAHVLGAPGLIVHSAWRSGRWTTPTAVSKDASWTSPALGSSSGGGLMAMWATAELVPPGGAMPRSFASVWTAGCASR
jgi:hypothetical protein